MCKIPVNGLPHSFFKAIGWCPSQAPDLFRGYGVAEIMAGPVLDKSDQLLAFIKEGKHGPGNLEIGLFIPRTDIVHFTGFPMAIDGINARAVVIDVQPVADMPSGPVYRQGLVRDRLYDKDRDQLFRVLGTARNYWSSVW